MEPWLAITASSGRRPPMTETCATPGMESSRGRSSNSAQDRSSSPAGSCSVATRVTCTISPVSEASGPMAGTRPGGRSRATVVSRSATRCLAASMGAPSSKST